MEKRNVNIQIARIIAMFSIVFCHCFNEIGNFFSFLGQLLNVGVFIFFIISAYLYGKKDIKEPKKWIKKKFLQICLPIYIWMLVVNCIYIVTNTNVNFYENFVYIFNLQAFINNNLLGLQHLWFISIILVLYIITLLLNKYKIYLLSQKNKTKIIMLFLIVLYVVTSFLNANLGRYIFYAIIYIYTYIYRHAGLLSQTLILALTKKEHFILQ